MTYKRQYLKNGVHVLAYPNLKTHQVNIGFRFRAGSYYEQSSQNGITHMLEHLFFRRLNQWKQRELYEIVNRMGGSLKGRTEDNSMLLDITVSPKYVVAAFHLLYEVFSEFSWTNEEFLEEKSAIKSQLEFRSLSYYDCINKIYSHKTKWQRPVGGTTESIDKLTLASIHRWKKKVISPANLCCTICGPVDQKEYAFIIKQLEAIPVGAGVLPLATEKPQQFCERSALSDKVISIDDSISDVTILFDVPPSLSLLSGILLSSILGQGDGALLSMELREKDGITDEVVSRMESAASYSTLSFEYSVRCQELIESLNRTFSIIWGCITAISQNDLDANIVFYTENERWKYDSPRELGMDASWRHFILDNTLVTIEENIDSFNKLNVDILQRTAKLLFRPENMTVIVSNNSKLVRKKDVKSALESIRTMQFT